MISLTTWLLYFCGGLIYSFIDFAILSAVLIFGGLWGLAGVFFAIPLATLIKVIMNAWPSRLEKVDSN